MQVLFRGKVLNTDEYVIGSYIYSEEDGHMIYTKREVNHKLYTATSKYRHMQIDEKTLSINFENMIDKNGKKIFASLNKNCIGGDECIDPRWKGKYDNYNLMVARLIDTVLGLTFVFDGDSSLLSYRDVEVIGIHKG